MEILNPFHICPWKLSQSSALRVSQVCRKSRGPSWKTLMGHRSWSPYFPGVWMRAAGAVSPAQHGYGRQLCAGRGQRTTLPWRWFTRQRKGISSRETRIRKGTETQMPLACSGNGEQFQAVRAQMQWRESLRWAADGMEREAFLNQAEDSVFFPRLCKSEPWNGILRFVF